MVQTTEQLERRVEDLEGWRKLVERKHDLTTITGFVEALMEEADFRARFTSARQQRWRRWKIRLTVLGLTIGVISATVNALQSLHPH